ncbi:hypothetical protein MWN34_10880 [Ancylobacter sp. 6x-1]|uniref:DUF4239 domain-containing protein n=1 Tax=Ancylobacter crimeensis TaxID=2579147 RepID=A0ABT0DCE1_9HYPH|nr:hypothetical protein [Ancylobacter crimeensis]MCK0197417.1 hypothetical protein [Ancylobacter crimeensis]
MNARLINAGLLVVAFLAALANYEGLALTIDAQTFWDRAFCAAIAIGVMSSILVFWHLAFHVVPQMLDPDHRLVAWLTTLFGTLCIVGLSAALNVAALGGHEARQVGLQEVVASAERSFAAGSQGSGRSIQPLLPDLDAFRTYLAGLAECEAEAGCVTSTKGRSGVAATLQQLAGAAGTIVEAVSRSQADLGAKGDAARSCLAAMRAALTKPVAIERRSEEVARQVDCFNAAMTEARGIDGAAQVGQALGSFTSGIVIPVTVKTAQQKEAVARILATIKQKADELARRAAALPISEAAEPVTMTRQNALQAVVTHASAIVPIWIVGIALDVLPLVLLVFVTIHAAAGRKDPDERMLDRPVRDVIEARRALPEIEAPRRRLPAPKEARR